MDIQEHKFDVKRTAHYYTYGDPKKAKYLWFAFHGYGQLASRLIRKFSGLNEKEHFVVAPEGLSKFYWNGVQGEVAASWMTKLHRLDEINDYCNYLNELKQHIENQYDNFDKTVLFGFSQGCATMWRWLHREQVHFDYLVNWAGWIPEDISYLHLKAYLESKQLFFIYGKQDEYLTQQRIAALKEIVDRNQLNIKIQAFEGNHVVDRKFLNEFVERTIIHP